MIEWAGLNLHFQRRPLPFTIAADQDHNAVAPNRRNLPLDGAARLLYS